MSISINTDQGQFDIPGGFADFGTQQTNSGLSTTGVLVLVGEADGGPDYTLEDDVDENSFGPDEQAAVLAKYIGGPIVNAFMGAISPSKDPDIAGAPSLIKIVKTNPSTRATLALAHVTEGSASSATYATLQDRNYGKRGNLFTATITDSPEVLPTTGTVDYVAPAANVTLKVRIDGGAVAGVNTITVTPTTTRDALVALLAAATGPNLVQPAATPGTLNVVAGTAAASLTISYPAGVLPVAGRGKCFEIFSADGGEAIFTLVGTTTPAAIVSTTAAPKLITSASERSVALSIRRAIDGISGTETVGGEIALQVGYFGDQGTVTIVPGTLPTDTTISLATPATLANAPTVTLADFPTMADLVAWMNTVPGFSAKATPALASISPLALDLLTGTQTCSASTPSVADATKPGVLPFRAKIDAQRFFDAVSAGGSVTLDGRSRAGLPDVLATTSFSGGARGATTQVGFQAAVDALKAVDCNFIVPLFSQDASVDVVQSITDSGSDYTIDSINAYVLAHCNEMSKITARRNRQVVVSKRNTWDAVRDAATVLGAGRAALAFQDVASVGQNGLAQFAPWMNAVKAAAAQAAAGPNAIFNKVMDVNGVFTTTVNTTTGALSIAKDFNPKDDTQVAKALQSGLLVMRKARAGGFRYASDQTTYSKDSNPVWNSLQAIYAADTVALTTAQRMEDAFVGKTLAKVSASLALTFVDTIMDEMIKLGYLARSDDAPRGYKDAKIKIVGPHMQVEVTIFLATALYFVTIRFQVNQVTQTAQQ